VVVEAAGHPTAAVAAVARPAVVAAEAEEELVVERRAEARTNKIMGGRRTDGLAEGNGQVASVRKTAASTGRAFSDIRYNHWNRN